jgi:M6 family metalloprotease-like protein/uncharacterized repeat protein (TIGR01451 family)
MRRGVFITVAAAALAVAALAATFAASSPGASSAQNCTALQKAKRVAALNAFRQQMPAKRRAFFRKTKGSKARRVFVERQQAQLRTLQRAARCRVPPARADVAVTMSVSGTTELVFTIVVQNRGPGRATEVDLTDVLPMGVELVSARATAGSCSPGTDVTCDLSSLASGATVTVTISARRYRLGVIENSVSVGSATPDPNPANNSATARSSDVPLPPSSSGPACSPNLTFPGERAYFHLGPTNYGYYLRATGRLAMLVLFVDFPDAPTSAPTEPIFTAAVQPAAQWYSEASYGRMTLAAERLGSWLRLPRPAVAYDFQYRGEYPGIVARHRAFFADAVAVADPLVDFSKYSIVLIVAAGAPGASARLGLPLAAGTGVIADGNELRGMVVASSPLARPPDLVHEVGHVFGLPDIYDFSVPFAEGTRNLGRWEPMSNTGSLAHFLGWVKWKLGWLDASQLRCVESPGALEETLSPIETPGGVKMVVLPTSSTTAKVVEVHTLRSVSNQVCDSGVIVYSVDVQARSGTVGARIMPARDDATTPECGAIPRAAFDVGPGERATYEDGELKVELLASDGSSYRVRVTRK